MQAEFLNYTNITFKVKRNRIKNVTLKIIKISNGHEHGHIYGNATRSPRLIIWPWTGTLTDLFQQIFLKLIFILKASVVTDSVPNLTE